MTNLTVTTGFRPLEKNATFGKTVADLGKGAFNLAFGGKTLANGAWKPGYGVSSIGKVKATNAIKAGDPLSGTRKFTAAGEDVFEPNRNIGKYLHQELQGARPSRADFHISQLAKNVELTPQQMAAKNIDPNATGFWGGKTTPKGVSQGEYQDMIRKGGANVAEDSKALSEINDLSMMDFIKRHPATAAKYYGTNAAHKGFFLGFPGYEAYNIMKNKEGPNPGEGMGSNLATSVGSGLGWAALAPLGLVGANAVVGGVSAGSRSVGRMVDQVMGNHPLQPKGGPMTAEQAQIPINPQAPMQQQQQYAQQQYAQQQMDPRLQYRSQ